MPILRFQMTNGRQITVHARSEATVIMQDRALTWTFDVGGRLVGAFREGRNYRRSFSNQIIEKSKSLGSGVSGRARRTLSPDEVRALEVEAYDFAGKVAMELRQLGPAEEGAALEAAQHALAHVNSYCYTSLERERDVYEHIYHPIAIMPPDQYLALYLQMTEGCAFNKCSFCSLFGGQTATERRFRLKPPQVFREHIRRVRAFMGEGLALRHSIFLGDANALVIPQKMLLPRFEILQEEFDILPSGLDLRARKDWTAAHPLYFDGIYSFVDAFSTRQKRAADFAALVKLGLRRVYVGLETGDAQLLKFLGKPNTPDDVVRLVNACKAGGVAVGVIVLVGAGGAKYARAHIRHTAQLVNGLPLDAHDFVYLSELIDFPDSMYSHLAARAGIRPLGDKEIQQQMQALRDAFSFPCPARRPQVSIYDIREFVY